MTNEAHQTRQFYDNFGHFSRQVGMYEAHFEQRHHGHDHEIQQLKLENQELRNDHARMQQVLDALQNFFPPSQQVNPPSRSSVLPVLSSNVPLPSGGARHIRRF